MQHGRFSGAEDLPITWSLHLPDAPAPHPCVVVVHGFKGFKDWGFFPTLCEQLAESGIAALRMNTSHNGVGLDDDQDQFTRLEVFARNRTSFEVHDVATALEHLRNSEGPLAGVVDRTRLGLLGHSRGGAAVILAAAGAHFEGPVVTWASVATTSFPEEARRQFLDRGQWEFLNGRTGQLMSLNIDAWQDVNPMPPELDLSLQTRQLGRNLCLLHGTEDTSVPVQAAWDLERFSDGQAHVHLIRNADHVMNCRHPFHGPTPEFDEAVGRSRAHFRRYFF